MTERRAAYGKPGEYNRRTDRNQSEIVQALRNVGASVQLIHRVGQGVPDLLVGWRGVNLLMEVKQPGERLNQREAKWHEAWRGQAAIVYCVLDAVELLEQVER